MAFLGGNVPDRNERFSLLLLEPGEIYFEDFSVFYYPRNLPEEEAIKKRQRGRLKICSKSVVFDPKDAQYPILKFPLRDVTKIDKWIGPLFSRLDAKNKMIVIESSQSVQMKEGNVITPYVFKKEKSQYLFSLTYVTDEDVLPQICQLHRASTLPLADQNVMINAIVLSRQARVKFDTSWLENLYEKIIMETQGDRITPLVTNPGRIMLTNSRLYFQPFNNVDPVPVLKIRLGDVTRVIKRRFLLRQVGLEIYCPSVTLCPHLYLSLKTETARDELYNNLLAQSELQLEDTGQEDITLKWQNGVISNYEYLVYLNSMADRSINDLTQYPVFPWVIADYTSSTLDLQNSKSFRDLSKPVGALNEERLKRLLERFTDMPEPRFLYGSHYSTPGFVLFYLARVAPEYMLCLQNGRFDHADRMFNSLYDAWNNCLNSYSDFKELIPEFYDSRGEFLENNALINFGTRQDGRPVSSVELPPWASDARDFVHKLQEALESDYVSDHLHEWIDLIFGYRQKGEEAVEANNLFYYLTYEGAVDLESINDMNHRAALEAQIMEFGQTPKQLFSNPHPQRFASSPRNYSVSSTEENVHSKGTPNHVDESSSSNSGEIVRNCVSPKSKPAVNPWANMQHLQSCHQHKLHKEAVTDVRWGPDGNAIFSVSRDTLLKLYSLEDQRQLRSIQLTTMPLSSCVVMDDGKTVIVGSWDNYIYIYSIEYGRTINNVYAHDDAVSGICLYKDNLFSSSWDSTVKVWSFTFSGKAATVDIMAELDHDSGVNCLCLNKDGSVIASGTKEGQIFLWDSSGYFTLSQHQGHSGVVHCIRFSPDGQRLISCGEDQYLRVMDISTGTEVYAKHTGQELLCLAWDGCTVLAGGSTGSLLVWDLVKVQLLNTIPSHTGAITCIDVNSEGRVLTGGDDRVVQVWTSV